MAQDKSGPKGKVTEAKTPSSGLSSSSPSPSPSSTFPSSPDGSIEKRPGAVSSGSSHQLTATSKSKPLSADDQEYNRNVLSMVRFIAEKFRERLENLAITEDKAEIKKLKDQLDLGFVIGSAVESTSSDIAATIRECQKDDKDLLFPEIKNRWHFVLELFPDKYRAVDSINDYLLTIFSVDQKSEIAAWMEQNKGYSLLILYSSEQNEISTWLNAHKDKGDAILLVNDRNQDVWYIYGKRRNGKFVEKEEIAVNFDLAKHLQQKNIAGSKTGDQMLLDLVMLHLDWSNVRGATRNILLIRESNSWCLYRLRYNSESQSKILEKEEVKAADIGGGLYGILEKQYSSLKSQNPSVIQDASSKILNAVISYLGPISQKRERYIINLVAIYQALNAERTINESQATCLAIYKFREALTTMFLVPGISGDISQVKTRLSLDVSRPKEVLTKYFQNDKVNSLLKQYAENIVHYLELMAQLDYTSFRANISQINQAAQEDQVTSLVAFFSDSLRKDLAACAFMLPSESEKFINTPVYLPISELNEFIQVIDYLFHSIKIVPEKTPKKYDDLFRDFRVSVRVKFKDDPELSSVLEDIPGGYLDSDEEYIAKIVKDANCYYQGYEDTDIVYGIEVPRYRSPNEKYLGKFITAMRDYLKRHSAQALGSDNSNMVTTLLEGFTTALKAIQHINCGISDVELKLSPEQKPLAQQMQSLGRKGVSVEALLKRLLSEQEMVQYGFVEKLQNFLAFYDLRVIFARTKQPINDYILLLRTIFTAIKDCRGGIKHLANDKLPLLTKAGEVLTLIEKESDLENNELFGSKIRIVLAAGRELNILKKNYLESPKVREYCDIVEQKIRANKAVESISHLLVVIKQVMATTDRATGVTEGCNTTHFEFIGFYQALESQLSHFSPHINGSRRASKAETELTVVLSGVQQKYQGSKDALSTYEKGLGQFHVFLLEHIGSLDKSLAALYQENEEVEKYIDIVNVLESLDVLENKFELYRYSRINIIPIVAGMIEEIQKSVLAKTKEKNTLLLAQELQQVVLTFLIHNQMVSLISCSRGEFLYNLLLLHNIFIANKEALQSGIKQMVIILNFLKKRSAVPPVQLSRMTSFCVVEDSPRTPTLNTKLANVGRADSTDKQKSPLFFSSSSSSSSSSSGSFNAPSTSTSAVISSSVTASNSSSSSSTTSTVNSSSSGGTSISSSVPSSSTTINLT